MAPEEAGREGAFKAAKKTSGIPTGQQPSEHFKVKDGDLFYICKIDIHGKAIPSVINVLNKHRASLLVYGNLQMGDPSWEVLFQSTERLSDSDALSWSPLAIQIAKRDLVGVRLFGMFDDIDNGVIVYEPVKFHQTHGDWGSR